MNQPSPEFLDKARESLNAALAALPFNQVRGWAGTFSFALAYSGGLDSRFLAYAAQKAGYKPLLLHAAGPHLAPGESAEAALWAEKQGLTLIQLPCDPLADVGMNDKERCYRCKKALFLRMLELGTPLTDGSNASDAVGYRPGRKALKELGVHSPLEQAGLSKAVLRALAAHMGMDRPDQPSRPCMLTRLNYGIKPEAPMLAALGRGEAALEMALEHRLGHRPCLRLRLVSEECLELHLLEAKPEQENDADFLSFANAILEQQALAPLSALRWNQGSGYFDSLP